MNYFDIIIIAIILILAIIGAKKGFVKSVIGILSLAASIALAWMLYPVIAKILEGVGIKTVIYEGVYNNIADKMSAGQTTIMLSKMLQQAIESGETAVLQAVANSVAATAINLIAFVLVLIISKIIIFIASKILIKISSISVIGFFNRILGGFFGVVQGVVIVYILLTAIYAFSPLKRNQEINEAIENSIIAKEMYFKNPITEMIEGKGDDEYGQSTN